MAKEKDATLGEIVRVVTARGADERIAGLIEDQKDEFPSPLDIRLDEPYREKYPAPSWADTKDFSYGWMDGYDAVRADQALNYDHWKIVTRTNHPRAKSSDFLVHGAVERLGMVLVYRPKELDVRARKIPEVRSKEALGSLLESHGGQIDGPSGSFEGFSHEPAGETVETADDFVLTDHPGQSDVS